MDTKTIACFFTIPETEFDYLEETLLEYDIGHYLIGFEVTPDNKKKEHFHLLFEGTDQIYNAFSKRIIEHYSLRGKGSGNKKYGKVREIRDLEKMCSYTVKEGNFRGNFPEEDIERWYNESFSKNEKVRTRELILENLDKYPYKDPNSLRLKAIQLLADIGFNNKPTRSAIESLVIEYYSRTGQNSKVFAMLYPCEICPVNQIYDIDSGYRKHQLEADALPNEEEDEVFLRAEAIEQARGPHYNLEIKDI